MFYSVELLSVKPELALAWLAGTMGSHRNLKGISRGEVVKVNLVTVCGYLLKPQVPLSIRFTASILLGIVRVHYRKMDFLLGDVTQAYRRVVSTFASIHETEYKSSQVKADFNAITLPDRPSFELWVELMNTALPPIYPTRTDLEWSIISPGLSFQEEQDITLSRDDSREAFREFDRGSLTPTFPLDDFRGELGTSFNFDDLEPLEPLEPIPEVSNLNLDHQNLDLGLETGPILITPLMEARFPSRPLTPLLEVPSLELPETLAGITRPTKRPRWDSTTELSSTEMDPNRIGLFDELHDQWSYENSKKIARLQTKEVFDSMLKPDPPISLISHLCEIWDSSLEQIPVPAGVETTGDREPSPTIPHPEFDLDLDLEPEPIPGPDLELDREENGDRTLDLPWETSPHDPYLSAFRTPSSSHSTPSDRSKTSSPTVRPRPSTSLSRFHQFLLPTPDVTSTHFPTILGDTPQRSTVAHAFYLLLELETKGEIVTDQPNPYETIKVSHPTH